MSINYSLLNIIIIICVCLNLGCNEGAQDREKKEINSHTIQVSSLLPSSSSSSCVLSPRAIKRKSSLDVTHRHGSCSPLNNGKATRPDHVEILKLDQARVNSIHSKLSKKRTANHVSQSQSTKLQAKAGSTLGSGNYIVTIGLGTPKNDLSLIFDTGSDLTWTQCEPCDTCYDQKEPKYNPSMSTSYNNVLCSSDVCGSLYSATGTPRRCNASNCLYGIQYGDQSFTTGFLATENFTLTSTEVFDGIYFGCGKNNQGLFNGVAGLLGLGRDKLSFPSQTASTYKKIFSYCLPSSADSTGYLTFGSTEISRSVKFTPIIEKNSFYGLSIVGISVGGQDLQSPSTVFSASGAIIDSGTVITRLPPKVYSELQSTFKAKMSQYPSTSGVSILETCYDFSAYDNVTIPIVEFQFSGGAVVELGTNGLLYVFNISQVCLAFAGNTDDNDVAIFGNVQQQTLEVVYDDMSGRVGFAPNGCS